MAAPGAQGKEASDASLVASRLDNFSCAEPSEPAPKRLIIRIIEAMTGRRFLLGLYAGLLRTRVPGESFWSAVIRGLDLKIDCNEDALLRLPRTGPLVIVANHPFGVLDGIILAHLASRVRDDFVIVTSSTVFYQTEEIRSHLLPIDFPKKKDVEYSLLSRQAAIGHLLRGGALVIFPAGQVSNTTKLWGRRAVDAEWKNFTARLIRSTKAPVVPFYIAGQNSRAFQVAGHINMRLRQTLFFKEIRDKIGSVLRVRVGEVLPYKQLNGLEGTKLMEHLRRKTYELESHKPHQEVSAVTEPARTIGEQQRRLIA